MAGAAASEAPAMATEDFRNSRRFELCIVDLLGFRNCLAVPPEERPIVVCAVCQPVYWQRLLNTIK
jgi:hypothetical protein